MEVRSTQGQNRAVRSTQGEGGVTLNIGKKYVRKMNQFFFSQNI